nr:carboxymuconolactone decarboxylase family protein [Desulfovibrio sp. TomC]
MTANERYERGYAALAALAPQKAQAVQDALADIAPDLGRFVVEFGYGDIFTRPGLTPAERQTATIAALTALGNAAPQLAFHVEAGLATGLSPEAIVEIIYVTTVFAGFPAGLNALAVCREVFAAKGVTVRQRPAHPDGETDRRTRGLATLAATSRDAGEKVVASMAGIAPDMADFLLDFSYGDVISRTILSPGQKEIAMIAAATARGTMAPQLKVHVKAARVVGLTREQIVEIMIQMAAYAGFPAALNGISATRDALAEMGE